jgi:hypothetical protein
LRDRVEKPDPNGDGLKDETISAVATLAAVEVGHLNQARSVVQGFLIEK